MVVAELFGVEFDPDLFTHARGQAALLFVAGGLEVEGGGRDDVQPACHGRAVDDSEDLSVAFARFKAAEMEHSWLCN